MIKVILCCSDGMSTSLFVMKMRQYAEDINVSIDITAIPIGELDNYIKDDVSVYVLAPQVKFHKDEIEECTKKPVYVIEMRDYGLMNIKNVLPAIMEAVKKG